jgi:hypothetical protein
VGSGFLQFCVRGVPEGGDVNKDRNTPNPNANKSKAEGDHSTAEIDTADERASAKTPGGEGGGITNRPLDEELENQDMVPDRGSSREGAHAGHGERKREEE